ncbi:MAG: RNase III inhibitor, partial [Dethiobacteria bacterium]|nr:RNase III inhibitor [Dethiobacteria bacterium]
AFPSIFIGVFGYSLEEVVLIAFRTVRDAVFALKVVKLIRFVLHGSEALTRHEQVLEQVFAETEK